MLMVDRLMLQLLYHNQEQKEVCTEPDERVTSNWTVIANSIAAGLFSCCLAFALYILVRYLLITNKG